MQDGVRLFARLSDLLDRLWCGNHKEFDLAGLSLSLNVFHNRQAAVGSSADHQPPAFPGDVLRCRQRRVAVGAAEWLGGLLLSLPYAAAIDHDVVLIGHAVDLDGAELERAEAHGLLLD